MNGSGCKEDLEVEVVVEDELKLAATGGVWDSLEDIVPAIVSTTDSEDSFPATVEGLVLINGWLCCVSREICGNKNGAEFKWWEQIGCEFGEKQALLGGGGGIYKDFTRVLYSGGEWGLGLLIFDREDNTLGNYWSRMKSSLEREYLIPGATFHAAGQG